MKMSSHKHARTNKTIQMEMKLKKKNIFSAHIFAIHKTKHIT